MSKQRAVSPHEITLADCQIHLKSAGGAITPKCKTFLFFFPPSQITTVCGNGIIQRMSDVLWKADANADC